MGIPGILKEIGRGERVALAKLAIEHLEKTNRPLRIAIDAAIWNFQTAASQGGKNPALRTLFFKLLKILALPIQPVFVYDGPNKPLTKRGKTVSRYGTRVENEMAKNLLSHFKFPYHTAPGEAEAECAILQTKGIVDAVMSQDADAIMFGSTLTLRDWSKEGTRGNKTPTHVNVLDALSVRKISGIDPAGMVLVALLSGGDYDEGVAGFGSSLACEVARAGFGTDLQDLAQSQNLKNLQEWKERLEYELQTNESGYFRRRHPKLNLPEEFPDPNVLGYYMTPAVSHPDVLSILEAKWTEQWNSDIDVALLRQYTAMTFDWTWKSGARRFVRCVAQPLFQDRLQKGLVQQSLYNADNIFDDRRHFVSDGILELRFEAVPADVVRIDIEAELDNPEFSSQIEAEPGEEELSNCDEAEAKEPTALLANPLKKRVPWSPYTAEKWWIPSTLLKLSLAHSVEEWEQRQRDTFADPKIFATRKSTKSQKRTTLVDKTMKPGAMLGFLVQPDEGLTTKMSRKAVQQTKTDSDGHISQVSPKASKRSFKTPQPVSAEESARSITHFFKPQKPFASAIPKVSLQYVKWDGFSVPRAREITCLEHNVSRDIEFALPDDHDKTAFPGSHISPRLETGCGSKEEARFEGNPQQLSNLDIPKTRPQDKADEKQFDASNKYIDPVQKTKQRAGTQRKQHARSRVQPSTTNAPQPKFISDPSISSEVAENHDATQEMEMSGSTRKKIVSGFRAIPRQSLPGAWTESGNGFEPKKDSKRVSYIDLTGN